MKADAFLDQVLTDVTRLEALTQRYRVKLYHNPHPITAPPFRNPEEAYKLVDKVVTPIVTGVLGLTGTPYRPALTVVSKEQARDEFAKKYVADFKRALIIDEDEALQWMPRKDTMNSAALRERMFDSGSQGESKVRNKYSAASHLAHELTHHLIDENRQTTNHPSSQAWEEAVCHAITITVGKALEIHDKRYGFYGNFFSWRSIHHHLKGMNDPHVQGTAAACLLYDKHGADAAKILLVNAK